MEPVLHDLVPARVKSSLPGVQVLGLDRLVDFVLFRLLLQDCLLPLLVSDLFFEPLVLPELLKFSVLLFGKELLLFRLDRVRINVVAQTCFFLLQLLFFSDLELQNFFKLGPSFGIVHFNLSNNFPQWLPRERLIRRVSFRICAQIDELSLLKHLGIFYFFYILRHPELVFVHFILSSRSILDSVLKPGLFQAVSLVWPVQV